MKCRNIWLSAGLLAAVLSVSCSDAAKPAETDLSSAKLPIINGEPDTDESHNGIVGLYNSAASDQCGDTGVMCTGTLIHPQWVLTAAHCVTIEVPAITGGNSSGKMSPCVHDMKIGIGADEAAMDTYDIEKVYFHKKYGVRVIEGDYAVLENDLALIKLRSPMPSDTAKVILPHPEWLRINSGDLPKKVLYVGYGYDENGGQGKRLKIEYPITHYCGPANSGDTEDGCRIGELTINGSGPNGESANGIEYVQMPYRSFYNDQKKGGTCQGDSGGPAILKIGGVEYVSMVTSHGDAICKVYNISDAVQDYNDWIKGIAPEVFTQYSEICCNGIDDNGDGLIDEQDSACADQVCGDESMDEDCGNQIDDNGDGRIDCDDPACEGSEACKPVHAAKEDCSTPQDDDGDGDINCDDSDCADSPQCSDDLETMCSNGIDDDGDGDVDCDSEKCYDADVCLSDDGCSTEPQKPAHMPFALLMAAFAGFGVMVRRRVRG